MNDIPTRARDLLRGWLDHRVDPPALAWLDDTVQRIAGGAPGRFFYPRFSLAVRRLGKADLGLAEGELAAAGEVRTGWDPRRWTCDQAARTLIVLALPTADSDPWQSTLDGVFRAADLGEAVALYQALPLLPHPERHRARAADGVRTNVRAVFEAVAHANPYPSEQLDEGAWNQMVLKALFVGSALHPIQGLDRRANPALAEMLLDYAHERWAADRPVPAELWRCVGPFPGEGGLTDLARVCERGTPPERRAAALALAACPLPGAGDLLATHRDLSDAVERGNASWKDL